MKRRLSPRLVFFTLLATVFVVCAVACSFDPIVADDWLAEQWRRSGHGFADLGAQISFNYRIYNPRLGEAFLYLTAGWKAIHVVLTPAVIVGTVVALFVLALGRWPEPRRLRDSALFLLLVALVCIGMGSLGENVFYRPFASNYLFGFCFQAWLLVPLRLSSRRSPWWAAPGMALLGFCAGMCNEHTGPTLILAYAGLALLAVRATREVKPWMVTGFLGVVAGFAALFFAPGLRVRAGGIGKVPILQRIHQRGLAGAVEPWRILFREARLSLLLLVVAVGVALYLRRRARRGDLLPPAVLGLFAGAALVTATLIASPFQGARLTLAPCLVLSAAVLAALAPLVQPRRVLLAVVAASALVVGYHAVRLVAAQAQLATDYAQRFAILAEKRPKFEIVPVPPTHDFHRPHWVVTDELAQDGWRRALAARFDARALVLDTTDLKVLALSGVSTDWMGDRRFINHLAKDQPWPLSGRLDLGFFQRVRAYADEWGPRLALVQPKVDTFCLRALLAPRLSDGRTVCVERWVKGAPSPLATRAADGTWHVPAAAWPFRESFVVSLDGVRTPLTSTTSGDEQVLSASGAPGGAGLHLLLGCDDVCVIGAAF